MRTHLDFIEPVLVVASLLPLSLSSMVAAIVVVEVDVDGVT